MPVLSPSVQEGHGSCRECPENGSRAGEGAGAKGGTAEDVLPGEKKAQREPYRSLQLPERRL